MGFRCSKIYNNLSATRLQALRVGLFGLCNSGKTTILYQFRSGYNIDAKPTFGFNVETICFHGILIHMWEIGGSRQEKTQALWKHYNQKINAIIFVVDASDLFNLPKAIQALQFVYFQPQLSEACYLIYANKQDSPNVLTPKDITKIFDLEKLLPYQKWAVQPCSAVRGYGLEEGMFKLLNLCQINQPNEIFHHYNCNCALK